MVRASGSFTHRFSKKCIRTEDGSMLVVSKKMKNMLKQELKTNATADMLVDDSNLEIKTPNITFEETLDESNRTTPLNNKLISGSLRTPVDDSIHRIMKKIPQRKRHKLRLQTHFNRHTNLKSALKSMVKNKETDKPLDVQLPVGGQSFFTKPSEASDSKTKLNNPRKVGNSRVKEKRPLAMNVLNSFRSILQEF
uniref:Uncharacterized protein n=1 Tax=Trichobilharzia regenti TaxID=157069 RepID=A0AA85K298_TRIRE|nr:unnamed protein product [Trichobilharzia regenti]